MAPYSVWAGRETNPARRTNKMSIPAEIVALAPNDKNLQISLCLRGLIDAGLTVREAWELLFGAGAWTKMAAQVQSASVLA